jgi:hypothetical protein
MGNDVSEYPSGCVQWETYSNTSQWVSWISIRYAGEIPMRIPAQLLKKW